MSLSFRSCGARRRTLFDYMHTYYRFRYWFEEVVPWYEAHGLSEITVLRPGSPAMHACKPLKAAGAPQAESAVA